MMTSARFTFLALAAAISMAAPFTGCVSHHTGEVRVANQPDENGDLPIKQEIHKTQQLAPNAQVEIGGINGAVEIETSNDQNAQIDIVRSARSQQTLDDQPLTLTPGPASLVIRNEHRTSGVWSMLKGAGEVRTRVKLHLPRRIRLEVSGVNGQLISGAIDGPVNVSGVNGKVRIGQAAAASSVSGINGPIEMTVAELGKEGIEMNGINGPITLRFAGETNADLEVNGLNGRFSDEGVNAVMQEKHNNHNFTARIGSGGSPVNLSGINGSVTLTRAGKTNVAAAPTATTSAK